MFGADAGAEVAASAVDAAAKQIRHIQTNRDFARCYTKLLAESLKNAYGFQTQQILTDADAIAAVKKVVKHVERQEAAESRNFSTFRLAKLKLRRKVRAMDVRSSDALAALLVKDFSDSLSETAPFKDLAPLIRQSVWESAALSAVVWIWALPNTPNTDVSETCRRYFLQISGESEEAD